MIEIIPTTISHVYELSRNLRDDDRSEITCFGKDPRKSIRHNYHASLWNKTGLIDGRVAAIWGLGGGRLGHIGMPWLLTTNIVEYYPLPFVIIYRREVKKMLEWFPRLENYVLSSYEKSVRLLGLAGFQLDDPMPVGPHNVLYRKFWKET